MASETTPVLRLQVKSSPTPLRLRAFAYPLLPAQIQLERVHGLPEESSGAICQVEIIGKSGALGNDNTSTKILSLLLLAPPFPPSFPTATPFLSTLVQRLTFRTHFTGFSHPTVADYHLWPALKTNVIAIGLLPKARHTQRWFSHLFALAPRAKALVDVPAQSKFTPAPAADMKDERKNKEKTNATFELGLPGAQKGKIVTRITNDPSGYLHVGYVKVAVLNHMNRSKEEADFEHSLVQDLALSAIIADATSHTPTTLRASAIRHPAHRGRQGVADGAEQEVTNYKHRQLEEGRIATVCASLSRLKRLPPGGFARLMVAGGQNGKITPGWR
ncbi:hypothetical protein NBRC10513_001070 [Rhodotorula toruloides]